MVEVYKIQVKNITKNSAHTLLETFIQNFKYAEEKKTNKNKLYNWCSVISLYKDGNA